jgi:hypothetical protein
MSAHHTPAPAPARSLYITRFVIKTSESRIEEE